MVGQRGLDVGGIRRPAVLSPSVFYLSPSDQARDHFKAKVNEVAYIKADSKVSPRVGGGGEEHIVM